MQACYTNLFDGMSGVLSSHLPAPEMVPKVVESDDDDDGWGSSDEECDTATDISNVIQMERPTWSMQERECIPELLKLENFVVDASGISLYRCEPAKKQNPTLKGLECLSEYSQVVVFIYLLNSAECVPMRTPDSKKKELNHCRLDGGIQLCPSKVHSVRFKKKCQDKSGNDLAFELGKGFMSHTAGTTPQFIFVAVPYSNGYIMNKAVRSPAFKVFSKRQERFLEPTQKKRRKNAEIQKLDTDIENAMTTFGTLEQDLRHANFIHSAMKSFFEQMRDQVENVEDETARVALAFALRCAQTPETASM